MIKAFGIKEAQAASKFATTPEARRTVLATMAMLGIKNTLNKNVHKTRCKVLKAVGKNDKVIIKLNKKYDKARQVEKEQSYQLDDLSFTSAEWTL